MANLSLNPRQVQDHIKSISKDLFKRMSLRVLWQGSGDTKRAKRHLCGRLRHAFHAQVKKWESAQLLETRLFDLSLWVFTQRPSGLSPAIEFHNLIQFILSVEILSMKQATRRGEMNGIGKGEEGKKQAKKMSARPGIVSSKGGNFRNSLGWPRSNPVDQFLEAYRVFQRIVNSELKLY